MSDDGLCQRCGCIHRLTCTDLACQMITIEDRMDDFNIRNEKFYAEMKPYMLDIQKRLKELEDKKCTIFRWWRKLVKRA